ncbi:MAG: rRNA maturation RNase YbeY [Chitinophagaceae bacterium]
MPTVSFSNADNKALFQFKPSLKRFIPEIFRLEGKPMESLQYVFCSDAYLLGINQTFLKHDNYTDIITFDLSDTGGTVGEIYISIERVKENAKQFTVPFQQEIQRILFHGALHLCGYRDKKKSEIASMRYKEETYLRLFEQWKSSKEPTRMCST